MCALTAGFGRSKITPPPNSYLAGYAARAVKSEGIHDDLYARALALSDGGRSVVMVSVDVLALDATFVERARLEIAIATGLPADAIMIAATHTHGGPLTATMFLPEGPAIDLQYVEDLRFGIVNAVAAAWKNRFRAQLGIGTAHVHGIGGNRHRLDGATDPELGVLKIADLGGRTRAVCLNYACHPTVLGPDNLLITADFPGFAVTRVEERLGEGSFAMFFNGASGNISVGRSPEATALGLTGPGRTFERAEKIGHELADLAVETLPSIETSEECPIDFASRSAKLELRPLPSSGETGAAIKQAEEALAERRKSGADSTELRKAQLDALYAALRHFEACRREKSEHSNQVEVQCFRIRDAVVVAMPVEPFVEIGLELKNAGNRLFVVELANGYLGYLPASGASEEHGYETVSARFMPGSDRIVIQSALALRRELLTKDHARLANP